MWNQEKTLILFMVDSAVQSLVKFILYYNTSEEWQRKVDFMLTRLYQVISYIIGYLYFYR